jgi:hypothetical protein
MIKSPVFLGDSTKGFPHYSPETYRALQRFHEEKGIIAAA